MSLINDETQITVSVKNFVAIISILLTFVATYFNTLEDLHMLQTEVAVLQDDLAEAQANIRELAIREMDK